MSFYLKRMKSENIFKNKKHLGSMVLELKSIKNRQQNNKKNTLHEKCIKIWHVIFINLDIIWKKKNKNKFYYL